MLKVQITEEGVRHLVTEAEQRTAGVFFTPGILALMRSMKALNPGDSYYENYLGHYNACDTIFFDQYHVAAWYGAFNAPRRILEIGTRTGISLAQLLAHYVGEQAWPEKIISVDPFPDEYASPAIVKMNLSRVGLPKHVIQSVEFRVEKSETALLDLQAQGLTFDYILVDGDHSPEPALADLVAAEQLVEVNGVIVFDDISKAGCDLLPTWEAWKAQERTAHFDFFERLEGKGTAWAVRRS